MSLGKSRLEFILKMGISSLLHYSSTADFVYTQVVCHNTLLSYNENIAYVAIVTSSNHFQVVC